MGEYRPLRFVGRARHELKGLPRAVYAEAGRWLNTIQEGKEPPDWRPMTSIGQGVAELRLRDSKGAYRVIYVAKFAEAVYVLHSFEKKSQKTSRQDLDIASTRYRDLLRQRAHHRGVR
ncbi:MAG: type II toxin-antitoxin system RelE/ParE family toxin [Devosia sp.]